MRTYRSGAVKAPLTPALSLADGERIGRKEISHFDSLNRTGKRQRTGAVQDANAPSGTSRPRDSVVECASPLALSPPFDRSEIHGEARDGAGERIGRKEISHFDFLNRTGKRQRTGAVQDANASCGTPGPRDSVVECASPLALSPPFDRNEVHG